MLKLIRIDDNDDETVLVRFDGDSDSDVRSFWLPGRILIEQVARICLDARVTEMVNDHIKEVRAKNTKKAA
jgi:hypothetical protein